MHQKLATLYARIANHPLAIRERQAVVALRPVDMAEAFYQLALAEYNGGEVDAARRSILRSLEIAPGYPEAQELLLTIIGGAEEEQ
jgi:tetratricopeptide (TPR) repeat protein